MTPNLFESIDAVPRAAKIGKPLREVEVEPVRRESPSRAPAEPAPPSKPTRKPQRAPKREPERV
jgi:hypothetical protein